MDDVSPIDAFLTGRLGEAELVSIIERVASHGTPAARTSLAADWRSKSGLIERADTRSRLDATIRPLLRPAPETAGDADTPPSQTPRPGDVLASRFMIEESIGSGGMGSVFKARDLRRVEARDRNPFVAIKTLNPDILKRSDAFQILQREARKAQNLAHPNIVRVYDFDRDGATLFLTMELLTGAALDDMIRANGQRGMTMVQVLPIVRQIAAALDFAHAEGIIHSDLKPSNIFVLPNGRVKVIDFGIARAIPNPAALVGDETVFDIRALGAMTPPYASPEMIAGLAPDPRDDVFALTCIVYEMITGRHPFGRVPSSVARSENMKPRTVPALSGSEWNAVMSGLNFDRRLRTATPGLLVAALERAPSVSTSRVPRLAPLTATVLALAMGVFVAGRNFDMFTPSPIPPPTQEASARQQPAEQPASDGGGGLTPELIARISQGEEQRAAEERAAELAAQTLAKQQAEQRAAQALAAQQAADDAARKLTAQQAADAAASQKQAEQRAAEAAAQKSLDQKLADSAAQKLAKQQAEQRAAQALAEQQAADDAARKLTAQQRPMPRQARSRPNSAPPKWRLESWRSRRLPIARHRSRHGKKLPSRRHRSQRSNRMSKRTHRSPRTPIRRPAGSLP